MKLCECGCGEPAPIAAATRVEFGHVKGEPTRFIRGHGTRGRTWPPQTRAKMSAAKRAEKNPRWNADPPEKAVHIWLERNFPKTGVCERCGARGRTDLSFQLHPAAYTRNRADYDELCRRCHMEGDGRIERRGANGQFIRQGESR